MPDRSDSAAMSLVRTVQELSLARDLPTIQAIVRAAARTLTHADGASFVLRENGMCYYADENAIAPLWKGKRFPMDACISGWAMLHREAAVVPDIYADARIPFDAYRPTFVKSLAMVPIRHLDPIGAIGTYWANHHEPSQEEVQILQALADSTAIAMEKVHLFGELEQRVKERTRELESAYEEIHRLAIVDELTGLHNRRGFLLLAEQSRKAAQRAGLAQFIVYVDADGLKQVNDTLGHHAGDDFLVALGHLLADTFREGDVVARMGGDEFCVLGTGELDAGALERRIDAALDRFNVSGRETRFRLNASVGVWRCPADATSSIEQIVSQADLRMYADKRARRLLPS